VGFAAPVALAAMAMASYLAEHVPVAPEWMALIAITVISMVHSMNLKQSERFQNIFTVMKLLVILVLIAVCFIWAPGDHTLELGDSWKREIWLPSFAVSLVFVSYAYSGWNAAAYIVEEIRDVRKNLPLALILGTSVVALLYVLLQLAFLKAAPVDLLVNKVEVGQVAATHILGPTGGRSISIIIAVLLVSSISAMVWVGPRVTKAIGDDYPIWTWLASVNKNGLPVRAIWLQWGLSAILILTGSFEKVLLYSGFILQASSMLAVAGLLRLRWKEPGLTGYKSPLYPFMQIIFLIFGTWILVFMIWDRPEESLFGMLNLVLGAFSYWYGKHKFG
jgi:APA family basic amino acid/polyamine antiporter